MPERKSALLLMLSALFSVVATMLVWYGTPHLRLPVWLPALWAGSAFTMGLLCWTLDSCRKYQPQFNVIAFVLAYLAIVAFAFLNGLALLPLALLVMAQLLVSLSFGHWVEYILFAVVSLGVFFFCILSLPSMAVSPTNFVGIMAIATVGGGLYTWWKAGKLNPETPADVLISQLIDQDTHALFLLDDRARTITFQNHAAARLWYQIGMEADGDGLQLLDKLGISHSYLLDRMEPSSSGKPERAYAQVQTGEGPPLRLEVSISKLDMPELPYFLLRVQDMTEQVAREHSIQRSLSINESLVQAIPDILITLDEKDHIQGFHIPALTQGRGKLRSFLGKPLSLLMGAFVPSAQRTDLQRLVDKARRSQHLVRGEATIPWGKQELVLEVRIMRISRGKELLGMLRNITDTKQADVAIRRSEENYRQIFNSVNEGIWVLDTETYEVLDMNEAALGMLQTSSHLLKARSALTLVHASEQSTFEQALKRAEEAGQQISLNLALSDQSTVPVEVHIQSATLDGDPRLIAVMRDIGEKLERHRALSESEEKYRALVENMNEGLVMTDGGERILFVNRRTAEIFQMSEAELLDTQTYELLGSEENQHILKEKQSLRKQGIADEYELKFIRKDGETTWLWIAGSPYFDSDGNLIGTIAILTDITDRKKAEQKLKEKNNELDAFVYKASHDLRGPLTSIIGVTNLTKLEITDPQSLHYFDLVNQSATRLDLILSELLDATRINKAAIQPEQVDIKALTQEVFTSVAHLETDASVSLEVDMDLPLLFYDPRLLRSLIQNLVVNAILYRNPNAHPSWVKVAARRQDQWLILSFADNGLGIPKRIQERVFEMFFRGNTASKGSGLGLYIVKNAIEKLGGSISFDSKEGEGTIFWVRIPWREEEEA